MRKAGKEPVKPVPEFDGTEHASHQVSLHEAGGEEVLTPQLPLYRAAGIPGIVTAAALNH